MILHIEPEQLLIYYPPLNDYLRREEQTFIRYFYASRAYVKSIIIVADTELMSVSKQLRGLISDLQFKRVNPDTSEGYWRADLNE